MLTFLCKRHLENEFQFRSVRVLCFPFPFLISDSHFSIKAIHKENSGEKKIYALNFWDVSVSILEK